MKSKEILKCSIIFLFQFIGHLLHIRVAFKLQSCILLSFTFLVTNRIFFKLQLRMYSIYKQTHPPTGIEHCVYCNFFNTSERNLVIAAVNKLYVYRLNPDPEVGVFSMQFGFKIFLCLKRIIPVHYFSIIFRKKRMKKMNQENQVDIINSSFLLTCFHSCVRHIQKNYWIWRAGSLDQVTSTVITMNLLYTIPSLT